MHTWPELGEGGGLVWEGNEERKETMFSRRNFETMRMKRSQFAPLEEAGVPFRTFGYAQSSSLGGLDGFL